MSNRTKSKLSTKKFRVTLLQQILNASHMDLMTEINVCKTIRQKIYVVFYNMNCSKYSNVWIYLDEHHHVSQSILASANWYCIFHISCTMYYTFHCVHSHCKFRVSHQYLCCLCYWLHSKTNAVYNQISWSNDLTFFLLKIYHRSVKRTSCKGWKGIALYLE